jgi:hypothetical protein
MFKYCLVRADDILHWYSDGILVVKIYQFCNSSGGMNVHLNVYRKIGYVVARGIHYKTWISNCRVIRGLGEVGGCRRY